MKILLLLLSYSAYFVLALNPIVIKGSKLFDSVTKEQFFIKGVAYQPRGQLEDNIPDPLANPKACQRDAAHMSKLGTNMIRVYEVNTKNDHDECMKIFEDAGIYLMLDIATPHFSVNRMAPEYNIHLFNAYKSTVDAFSKYSNLFGFIAGNEVSNDRTTTQASAYVKAALRDIKAYIKNTKSRHIPVGYASNDDQFIRDPIKDYFNCGEEEEQADFYGLNLYEWCGSSTYETSGYKERTNEYKDYTKPVFLSEYGCNVVAPRQFSEVEAIYGSAMTGVWSGGVVYEWTQENNNYGLVKVSESGDLEPLVDFENLKKYMDKIDPKGVHMDSYKVSKKKALRCPQISDVWKASSKLPPTPSEGACRCMRENLSCTLSEKMVDVADNNTVLGTQLDFMCTQTSCAEIGSDAEKGIYGAFSYCSPQDKLSWLYNLKSKELLSTSPGNACDYNGFGSQMTPKRSDLGECAKIAPNMNGASDETTKTMSSTTEASLVSATDPSPSVSAAHTIRINYLHASFFASCVCLLIC